MKRLVLASALVAVCVTCAAGTVAAQQKKFDRHAGYYYPPPISVEIYKARARMMKTATRTMRIGFIINLVKFLKKRPHPPAFSIFTKGGDAEKLIIVANQAGRLDTIYRVRAMLADMTALARQTPVFRKYKVETLFTFLDLLKMLGFKQITATDGDRFAHQVKVQ